MPAAAWFRVIVQVPVESVVTTPADETEHTVGLVVAYAIGWPEVLEAAIETVPPLL